MWKKKICWRPDITRPKYGGINKSINQSHQTTSQTKNQLISYSNRIINSSLISQKVNHSINQSICMLCSLDVMVTLAYIRNYRSFTFMLKRYVFSKKVILSLYLFSRILFFSPKYRKIFRFFLFWCFILNVFVVKPIFLNIGHLSKIGTLLMPVKSRLYFSFPVFQSQWPFWPYKV